MKFTFDYVRNKLMGSLPLGIVTGWFSQRNPFAKRPFASLGVLTTATISLMTTWYYKRRYDHLVVVTKEVEAFDKETVTQLNEYPLSTLFEPLDKSYLMHEPRFADFATHREIRNQLQRQSEQINLLSHQLQSFSWFKAIGYSSLNAAEEKLNSIFTRTLFTEDVNNALYHLKTKLYAVAEGAILRAINRLKDYPRLRVEQLASPRLRQAYLSAHTFNIAAKVARGQENFEKSDDYYVQALQQQPDNAEILSSQVALWSDMVWAVEEKVNPKKLLRLIEEPRYFEGLVRKFEHYGLGLANLSWALLQATEKLSLLPEKQRWCLDNAYRLAAKSIPLIEQQEAHKQSINGLLFFGIAQMKRGENEEALSTFDRALKKEHYHPSLLLRRAMALEALARWSEAYWAYQHVRVELSHRLQSRDKVPSRYKSWLTLVEEQTLPMLQRRLQAETGSPEGVKLNTAIDLLMNAHYSSAYETLKNLQGIPAEQLRAWLLNEERFRKLPTGTGYQFIPTSKQEWLIRLGLYQHPTPYLLSALSIAAYEFRRNQPGALPPGWSEIGRSSEWLPHSRGCGYLAIACRNYNTGQIVIVHAGTDMDEMADYKTDFELALGKDYEQLKWATQFTELVSQKVLESKPTDTNKSLQSTLPFIYHTGHSLGGAIAAYLACTWTSHDPYHAHYAIGLDNPSPWWALNRFYRDALKTRLHPNKDKAYPNFPITSFLSRPSLINCAGGPRLGQTIHLPVYCETAMPLGPVLLEQVKHLIERWVIRYVAEQTNWPVSEILAYRDYLKIALATADTNLQFHDKERIQATFDNTRENEVYAQPTRTYYVRTWPRDLWRWLIFESQCAGSPMLTTQYSADAAQGKVSHDLFALIPVKNKSPVGFHEAIPLKGIEKNLAKLLKHHLSKKEGSNELLDDNQKVWLKYIDSSVLSCLALDESEQHVLIKAPLTGWELLAYFRQQAYEAYQVEKLPWLTVLYPDIRRLPRSSLLSQYGIFNQSTVNSFGSKAQPQPIDDPIFSTIEESQLSTSPGNLRQ